MAGLTATGPLERLARERVALVAWLGSRFRSRLSHEDCEDIVAEALPRLADDPYLPADPARAGAYVRRALWRDALDELRHRHGRELERRAPLSLELADEQPQPGADVEGRLVQRQEREQLQAAAARMLERLSPTEAKVLRLKFLDEVEPDRIADELGLSRSQYQRRLTAACRHALDALVDAHSGPACPHVRRLIIERPVGLLDREDAGRRDAHLDECVHCRAFSLRARGALELLPLPAAGMLERLSSRVSHLVGRGGEVLVGLRDGHEVVAGASAGAAGAGAALSAGLGAKLAVGCAGAAVAVMCASPLGVMPGGDRPSHEHAVAKHATSKRSASTAKAPADTTRLAAVATPAPTPASTGSNQSAASVRRTVAGAGRRAGRRATAAQEFGPESSVPAERTASVAVASNQGGEFSPPPPPPPMPKSAARSSAPASSSFAGEFAP